MKYLPLNISFVLTFPTHPSTTSTAIIYPKIYLKIIAIISLRIKFNSTKSISHRPVSELRCTGNRVMSSAVSGMGNDGSNCIFDKPGISIPSIYTQVLYNVRKKTIPVQDKKNTLKNTSDIGTSVQKFTDTEEDTAST